MGTKKRIILSILTLFIAGNLFLLFYLQNSQLKQIAQLQNELVKSRKQMSDSKKQQKIERKKKGNEGSHIHQVQEDIRKVVASLPHVFSITEYAGSITSMLERHRLSTGEGLLFTPEKSERLGLTRYFTNIAATGKYSDMKAFIAEIGTLPELVCMERIEFKRSADNLNLIELSLGISIYFRGDLNG